MSRLRSWLFAALLAAVPNAAAAAPFTLPGTPAGRLAGEWLAAYNSGDPEAVRAFTARVVPAEDLKARPMEQRLANYQRMHGDLGTITFVEVLDDDPERFTALARTAGGERVAVTVETKPGAPQQLQGVRIEQAGEEGEPPPPRTAAGPPLDPPALRDSIDAFLARPGDQGPFSGVVHVAQGDQVLYSRAFGQADRAAGTANTVDTKFNIGSINKLFTRVAIGQLAAAGKLKLDDRLSAYLPDWPKAVADRVTLQQLLEHRSGLGDFFGPRFDADPAKLLTLADYAALFRDDPLRFEPGADQFYSNAGYVLLGLVIEKVSGMSYDAYMAAHVFAPAGMTATGPSTRVPALPGQAIGYTRRTRGHESGAGPDRANTSMLPGHSSSAGGGYSTAADLVRFGRALRAGRLVPAAYLSWAFGGPPPVPGETLPPPAGEMGIAGGAPGLNAELHLWLDRDLTLVVLVNQDPPAAERRARAIAGWVRRTRVPAS